MKYVSVMHIDRHHNRLCGIAFLFKKDKLKTDARLDVNYMLDIDGKPTYYPNRLILCGTCGNPIKPTDLETVAEIEQRLKNTH